VLYNLVDDQRLGKHELLFQPWVKSKRSVYWMHVDDDTLLIGDNGMKPASIFCVTFLNKSPFLVSRRRQP
jgi:hypothetical protein